MLLTVPFLFDFLAILFDVPALIWYGWLKVLAQDGHCDDSVFGIWFQPYIGVLFLLSYYTVKMIVMLPFKYADMVNERANGLSKGNCRSFLLTEIVGKFLMQRVLNEMVLFYVASLILTAVEEHFYAVAFGVTLIVMLYTLFILPKCSCCVVKYEKWPQEHAKLKADMLEIFKKEGYTNENLVVQKNRGGDLHANAHVKAR